MNAQDLARALSAPGRNAHPFTDEMHGAGKPLVLHAYRPAGFTPDSPVVFVQHGMGRNGDEYRDFWIEAADRHGLLILAPTFSAETHPGAETYNNGGVLDDAGAITPAQGWAYHIPARIFALLREAGVTRRTQAFLFGHSAGSQFAHRMASLTDRSPFCAIGCGNAGWYSLPTLDRRFPEGLGGLGLADADLEAWLAYPLLILAGDADTETSGPSLPSNPEAVVQGPHRFARAHNFLAFARSEAARRGVPCHWRMEMVPGIGHDGNAMSKVCAAIWFEGRQPEAARMAELAGKVAL
ncbi:alpha/beta hydrolase [Neoroseomonas soli]|uniref:Alpha/beta hydrolase n=1 Tax=Neoroseomonas soli TaxID=1081025 RepID=A0A9X9WT36_9PROT|nr:alpha/beta hydrolase [Neoroseomonas soli]MBR0670315.1 alpha/beta hydrolase [Neoroseomonas soli]